MGYEIVADSVDLGSVEDWENREKGKFRSLPRLGNYDDPFYWSSDEIPTEYMMYRSAWCTSVEAEGTVHLVIGPDLVSEWKAKKEGKAVAATATTTAASSSGSCKAWQEKGNAAWLTLPNGEKLEFAKCPAGKSTILYSWKDGHKFFRATITRPYWISKTPLQGKNVNGLASASGLSGGDILESKRENVDMFFETLTDDLRDVLPKGYVVRLPSFVEWQYAYTEGGRAKTAPYNCLTRYLWGDKEAEGWYDEIKIPDAKNGGRSRANGWGLSHWHVVEKVLDRMLEGNSTFKASYKEVTALEKPSDVRDPLWWGEVSEGADEKHDGQMCVCVRSGATPGTYGTRCGTARLVVGPDLVSEWKAKHGKK